MGFKAAFGALGQRIGEALAGPSFHGAAGAAVAVVARDGSILMMGQGAERLLAGARGARRFPGLFAEEARPAIETALEGPIVRRMEARARRPGGNEIMVDLIFERRDDDFWTVLMIERGEPAKAAPAPAPEHAPAPAGESAVWVQRWKGRPLM